MTRVVCPVCVFHATNVNVVDLGDSRCWNCGDRYADHRLEVRGIVPPGKALAVDESAVASVAQPDKEIDA